LVLKVREDHKVFKVPKVLKVPKVHRVSRVSRVKKVRWVILAMELTSKDKLQFLKTFLLIHSKMMLGNP
jgi:hypothetical protein